MTNTADLIIRIKNAALARRKTVKIGHSKVNKVILSLLVKEGFLDNIKEEGQKGKKELVATIRYEERLPVITDCEIISKPSLRIYSDKKEMAGRKGNRLGIVVISTSSGIMTESHAKKKGIGGELLFRVW